MEQNTATIISGFLSMAGGIAGAAGAYWIANLQMKKQFKKNDDDRALELRINKLNEALLIVNDYLSALNRVKGKISNIEWNVKKTLERGDTQVTKDNVLKEPDFSDLKRNILHFDSFKNDLKKYKIFVGDVINYENLYVSTGNIIDSYKIYLKYFDNEEESSKASEFDCDYSEKLRKCDRDYSKLNDALINIISDIEKEILRLLKVK